MTISKLLMGLGLGLFILGAVLGVMPNSFNWFGRLPGDIRIEEENRFIFFPITSMIVISVVLSLLVNLFLKK
jgi:hypothetical protein